MSATGYGYSSKASTSNVVSSISVPTRELTAPWTSRERSKAAVPVPRPGIRQESENLWERGPPRPEVKRFLHGPQPRGFETVRALRIFWELLHGFRSLHFVGPCVTVFGSARFTEDQPYYRLAREVGSRLAQAGFTGHDRRRAGYHGGGQSRSQGSGRLLRRLQYRTRDQQQPNPYLDRWVTFRHFYVRKTMLVKYSYAFIAMPGGFGTLDEVFETATLIQTHKVQNFPLVLMGRDYWRPLIDFFRERLLPAKTIDPWMPIESCFWIRPRKR